MIVALKLIVLVLIIFTALGLASAVTVALRRDPGIGRRLPATPADPIATNGSAAGALRRSAGGGRAVPSGSAAVRTFGGRNG